MKYNCEITKQGEWFNVVFPDMTNIQTCAKTYDESLKMAQEALNGVLESCIENNFPIAEPAYKDGVTIEVSAKVAFAIELRRARAGRTQSEIAKQIGMSYQQYQRLENPRKTNPTLETIEKLQKVFLRQFLAL